MSNRSPFNRSTQSRALDEELRRLRTTTPDTAAASDAATIASLQAQITQIESLVAQLREGGVVVRAVSGTDEEPIFYLEVDGNEFTVSGSGSTRRIDFTTLTTKGDLLGYSTLPARVAVGADNYVLTADSAQALGLKWAALSSLSADVPRWTKITKGEADWNIAGLTGDIEIYSLPAGGVLHAVKIKHSASFDDGGGPITACTLSVGIVGNLTKYAPAFDVYQATGATIFQISSTVGSEDHSAATSIRGAMTTVGGFLNALTTGSVDIWLLVSTAT